MTVNRFLAYVVLSIILLIVAVPVFGANKVPMIYESGQITMVEESSRPLTTEEAQAFKNPGQKVPIGLPKVYFEKIDFWHVVKVKEYDSAVVYQDGQMQTIQEISIEKNEPELVIYKFWCLVAMALMLVSNLLMILSLKSTMFRNCNTIVIPFVYFSLVCTIATLLSNPNFENDIIFRFVSVLAFFIASLHCFFHYGKETYLMFYKKYVIFSIIYYLLMILLFIL